MDNTWEDDDVKLFDGGLQIASDLSPGAGAAFGHRRAAKFWWRRSGQFAPARRGISLLEVLISMFVMLVGVVSVFSLIALGRFEMLEGSKADRGMSLARSGQKTLLAIGALRPVQLDASSTTSQYLPMWYSAPDTSTNYHYLWGPGGLTPPAAWPAGTYPSMPFDVGNIAYAIDPLGVAANTPNASNVGSVIKSFPAYYNNGVFNPPATPMTRITLRAAPSSSFGPMSIAQADAIFRSQDDLVLNPVVGDYPPTQEFSLTVPSTGAPTRRQSAGDYSWMATVVPTQGDTKMCLVSIVVFYKRNFLLPQAPTVTDPTTPPPERMVNLTAASGNSGLGGGDVILSCPATLPSDYIKVKPQQWILLSQVPAAPGFWRWYRVLATSDPVLNSGNWVRQVTLAGPDWNPSAAQAFASIFDGVIGVYERNIELEESGALWSPN